MTTMDMLPADADARRSAVQSYRLPAKVFHWLTVALVAFMVSSAVIAKQLNGGPWSDTLFMLHKTTGIITLAVVLMRLLYRIVQWLTSPQPLQPRRVALHWLLYAIVIAVPLAGWAGISDFGSREVFPGFTVLAIWPEHAGYADALFAVHAYLAFGLLALVALHVGIAIQDHMTRADNPAPHDDQML